MIATVCMSVYFILGYVVRRLVIIIIIIRQFIIINKHNEDYTKKQLL